MNDDNIIPNQYGFYFERAGLSGEQGQTLASEEIFRGGNAEMATSVTRELIQNSIDARDPNAKGPVHVEFDLQEMPITAIPDHENLGRHIDAAAHDMNVDKNNKRLSNILRTFESGTIPVLRVGDYNTTGLTGGESLKDLGSPLGALTRGSGISTGKIEAGGSFGVGKSAGLAASSLRTELWTTRTLKGDESILAGLSILATHYNPDHRENPDDRCMADGHFTLKNKTDDFQYYRARSIKIGQFDPRVMPGTDTYILGYLDATDTNLEHIRQAVVDNFMAAIYWGELTVSIGQWTLNQDTIKNECRRNQQELAFLNALQETPIVENIPDLGEVKLYVNIDDTLDRNLFTNCMRKPHMKVFNLRQNQMPAKYAAIFECSDSKGNEVLRQMEDVTHTQWNKNKNPQSTKIMRQIRHFINTHIHDKIKAQEGNVQELTIKGLNSILPNEFDQSETNISQNKAVDHGPDKHHGENNKESSHQHGEEEDAKVVPQSTSPAIPVAIRNPGLNDGGNDVSSTGKKNGGDGKRNGHSTGLPGHGTEGEGASEILNPKITMRSYYDKRKNSYILILRGFDEQPISGNLKLTALLDGQEEVHYELPLVSARDISEGKELNIAGNMITNIMIKAKTPKRLLVNINSNEPLALAVSTK
jgi:hypothetical protein